MPHCMPGAIVRTAIALVLLGLGGHGARANDDLFRTRVAPVFERACLSCHNENDKKGGLALESAKGLNAGGESGAVVEAGNPGDSILVDYISGAKPQMPKKGPPLAKEEVKAIRDWVAAGAKWPEGVTLKEKHLEDKNWWSLQPLAAKPALPKLNAEDAKWAKTPIDAFLMAKLREKGLGPSPEADRRTLIRRLYFDLLGLPPTPEEVDAFVRDDAADAYTKLVDRLLESPHYGERWARHWLDVVHYGDTHGFDKDKVRPNAWPYRDYVVRAINTDKPYARFVEEQLAGDVLYPETVDGIEALGFIAAGPFDFVGHIELSEAKTDGKIARMLDRDDMVRTTMETFTSSTAGCARCHNHKFDPITQEDYYSLQAVFAAVDRNDRPYDREPATAAKRAELLARQKQLGPRRAELQKKIVGLAGPELEALEKKLEALLKVSPAGPRAEFGYHSALSPKQDVAKWVQIDLGQPTLISHVLYVGCLDDFNAIGAGFGFPVRFKIEISNDEKFEQDVELVVDHTGADFPNPGVKPQSAAVAKKRARYVRVTATKLAPRKDDFNFAMAEISVLTPFGRNAALGATVTALDSIEAPVRWTRKNLVDGYYVGVGKSDPQEIADLNSERDALLAKALDEPTRKELAELDAAEKQIAAALKALPAQQVVYAAATQFDPQGGHVASGGKPREIAVLKRGDIKSPMQVVTPGTISAVTALPTRFAETATQAEGQRRAALARWIVDPRNPLTWRSVVNRVWQNHFGRGIVDSPNDFGRMGAQPTHPELLDYLAVWFRDEAHGSMKQLHRLLLNSAAYKQASSRGSALVGGTDPASIDAGNQFLWRMNRRRLDAESIRDSVLAASGQLDETLGGPGYRVFGFKDDHSPHYLYEEYDPNDAKSHRRSIYRFIVRSVPDPFMETLDCADPSLITDRRNETLTALQALALLNNKFMVRMSENFAERVETAAAKKDDWNAKITAAYRLAYGRLPTSTETAELTELGQKYGFANVCRLIFNANEFVFVD